MINDKHSTITRYAFEKETENENDDNTYKDSHPFQHHRNMTDTNAVIQSVRKFLADNPAIPKWIKWGIIFKVLRIKNSFYWTNFVTLNKPIKNLLIQNSNTNDPNIHRRLSKCANAISCVFLYCATVNSKLIPKDYLLIYLLINYVGKLNPPSNTKILVSPKYSQYLKTSNYQPWLNQLYEKKHFFIFPAIVAQILSNYLTPTKYKLNQRYLSSLLKKYILNPIWINYKLGINYNRVNWISLFRTYCFQNVVLMFAMGLYFFKSKLLDRLYEIKHNKDEKKDYNTIIQDYFAYVTHKSNSFINLIFGVNLISILLISLTSPVFRALTPKTTTNMNWIQLLYVNHLKLFFKSYTKIIGFAAGLITLCLNSINLIPSWGYSGHESIREIKPAVFNSINLYLFRLILLSKWRIIKFKHPLFTKVTRGNWNKLETVLMSFAIWKIMNLNDFLNSTAKANIEYERKELLANPMVKLVNYIM